MKRKMNQAVGSTTVRADGIRYIKVTMDGPSNRRWMQYARFLWEAVNGAVPAGKRVLHKDGDVQNDDIRNLMLGTASDVLWIHCHKDPKKSAANHRAVAVRYHFKVEGEEKAFVWLFAAIPLVTFGIGFGASAEKAGKAWLAPRIVVLEKISTLVQ